MKKFTLLLAVLMTAGCLSACQNQAPAETVPPETTVLITETAPEPTTQPTEEPTVPPTTVPIIPVVVDFKLDLPQGFTPTLMEDHLQIYSSPQSPRDPSEIRVEILPRDEFVLELDGENMSRRILNPAVPQETVPVSVPTDATEVPEETEVTDAEEDVVLDIRSIQTLTLDGWETVMTDYVRPCDGYYAHIYRYEAVTTEANYVFSFSDGTDNNDWLESFGDLAETIDFILDTEGVEMDYSGLTRYEMDCGLNLYAEDGLEPHEAKGFSGALANKNILFLVMEDRKEENHLTSLNLEEYAKLVADSNQLPQFDTDPYGNLFTTFYSSDDAGLEYYNLICVKDTGDSFWVCQMTCLEDDQVDYVKDFPLWASSIGSI